MGDVKLWNSLLRMLEICMVHRAIRSLRNRNSARAIEYVGIMSNHVCKGADCLRLCRQSAGAALSHSLFGLAKHLRASAVKNLIEIYLRENLVYSYRIKVFPLKKVTVTYWIAAAVLTTAWLTLCFSCQPLLPSLEICIL